VESTAGAKAPVKSASPGSSGGPVAAELFVYPNPAGSSVSLRYELAGPSVVSISICSIMGKQVASVLNNAQREAGTLEVGYDVSSLPPGIYLVTLVASSETGRVVNLMKKLVISR